MNRLRTIAIGRSMLTVVGTDSSCFGCSCEHHTCCGKEVLDHDTVVRFTRKHVQLQPDPKNTTARKRKFVEVIAAVWITDGDERCILGHLPSKYDSMAVDLEGRCAMVVDVFRLSDSRTKRNYSTKNEGACYVRLIDRDTEELDQQIGSIMSEVESDVEATDEP